MPAKYTLVLRKDMRKGAAEGSKLFMRTRKRQGRVVCMSYAI